MPTLTLTSIKEALFPKDYTILDKVPRIQFTTFEYLLKQAKSPAYPEAQKCWNAIRAHGVDPAFALAQFRQESSYGTAGIAVGNKSWGNIRRGGVFVSYSSWEAGAEDYAALVSGYLYAGDSSFNTARKLPYRYAPSADHNNPANYGRNLVAFIGAFITLDKSLAPKPVTPPTGGTVSTDRATTLAEAIQKRVGYIQALLVGRNMDPAAYTDHLNAISTYTKELQAVAGGAPVDTATPESLAAAPASTTTVPVPATQEPTSYQRTIAGVTYGPYNADQVKAIIAGLGGITPQQYYDNMCNGIMAGLTPARLAEINAGGDVPTLQKQLADAQAQLASLNASEEGHSQTAQQIAEMSSVENEIARLQTAINTNLDAQRTIIGQQQELAANPAQLFGNEILMLVAAGLVTPGVWNRA